MKNTAKDHSSNIVEEEELIEVDKYKCIKFKKIVLKADAFSNYKEDGQEWCSLCTILNYGSK